MTVRRLPMSVAAAALAGLSAGVWAQPAQVVKPPLAQAWIDVATFGGMGMPMGLPGAGGGNPLAALGSLFGGGGGGANRFGQTQGM